MVSPRKKNSVSRSVSAGAQHVAASADRERPTAAGAKTRRTHHRRGARLGRGSSPRVPKSIKEPAPAAAITPTSAPKTKEDVDDFVRWEGEGGHPSHGASAPPSRDVTTAPTLPDARIDPVEDRAGGGKAPTRAPASPRSTSPRGRGSRRSTGKR